MSHTHINTHKRKLVWILYANNGELREGGKNNYKILKGKSKQSKDVSM